MKLTCKVRSNKGYYSSCFYVSGTLGSLREGAKSALNKDALEKPEEL